MDVARRDGDAAVLVGVASAERGEGDGQENEGTAEAVRVEDVCQRAQPSGGLPGDAAHRGEGCAAQERPGASGGDGEKVPHAFEYAAGRDDLTEVFSGELGRGIVRRFGGVDVVCQSAVRCRGPEGPSTPGYALRSG